MPYIGRSTDGFGVRSRFIYLASSGDTSVSGADANGATLTFTDGAYVDVYLNGVLLKPTTDYNTSTANTIAGLSALNTNDEVTVVVYDVFTVADMVSATSGGTFNSGVNIDGNVGLGTTTPATSLEISGTTENTQGGVFPRIQITTTSDVNPTYSGSLDIVEKQSSATSSAVFGENHLYGFRMMLDGYNNILKWFSGSQTTVTERMGLDRDTGNLTLNTGNLIMGTSGKGIDFSATGDGSGTDSSELLDDYEEGTWTATATAYGGTFSASEANYIKVGRMVYINVACSFSGTDSDRIIIAGLPYASTNTSALAIYYSQGPFDHLKMLVSGTSIYGANTNGDATYTSASGMTVRFSGTYMATA